MKKRQGFTLIELLAVIVILAIIALIATPIVLNIIEKARKSAYQDSAYGLIEAAKLKYVEGMLDGSSSVATYTFDGTADSGLEFSGSAPDSGELKVDSNGNVALAVIYGNVCYKKDYAESEVTQSDDTANCNLGATTPTVSYKCKRATTLHTEECTRESAYCYTAGYTADNKGTTITYGHLGALGTLASGDTFDCDVNGDGTYDSTTERFYYVSDLYNTTTKTFDSNYAVLVYYNNTTAGVADNTSASLIAYYAAADENWHGPVTAMTNLPTTSQWTNVSLTNTNRALLTETGTTTTTDGTNTYNLPTTIDYSGYAARLLTYQEVANGCPKDSTSNEVTAANCLYLIENSKYSSNELGTSGYWLETPTATRPYHTWASFTYIYNSFINPSATAFFGTRPAIEVLKTDMEI